jgi:dihydropteroate synthase
MGVLNVTPDSFWDGGRFASLEAAAERARAMVDEGVDLIDIGGESTRPGADDVPADEELARVVPVVEAVASLAVPISVDTRKATVAKAALDAGASVVNDVSAGTFDDAMLPLVADRGVPIVLMHMRGTPKTMDSLASYDDVVAEVRAELDSRVEAARLAGASSIWIDPGLGFAKKAEHSIELLRHVDELRDLGRPLVVGPSRKRFIQDPIDRRLGGTLAVVAWCAMRHVDVVRVHDVLEARRVVDMIARLS